jgi:hypothetical protein
MNRFRAVAIRAIAGRELRSTLFNMGIYVAIALGLIVASFMIYTYVTGIMGTARKVMTNTKKRMTEVLTLRVMLERNIPNEAMHPARNSDRMIIFKNPTPSANLEIADITTK